MAERKPKLTATLPDGTIATRATFRQYQFVVAVRDRIRRWPLDPDGPGSWSAGSWHSDRQRASAGAANFAGVYREIQIVPVDGTGEVA